MILKIYPDNPAPRHIKTVIDILNKGGIVIFPTDTIYGMGCSIEHIKTVDRIARIKGVKKEKANYSIIINNLSMLSEFAKPVDNHIFRIMKKNLPLMKLRMIKRKEKKKTKILKIRKEKIKKIKRKEKQKTRRSKKLMKKKLKKMKMEK